MVTFIKFHGVDYNNRPIFKCVSTGLFYGSTDILFSEEATEVEVLDRITVKDLTYFGSKFGCEPMGTTPKYCLQIISDNHISIPKEH